MKKLLFIVCFLTSVVCVSAQTQKGNQAIVANIGYQTDAKRFLLGAQYRYAFVDNFRVAPDVMFFFPKNKITGLDVNINVHYTVNLTSEMYVYPLMGLAMQNNRYKGETIHGVKNKSRGYTDWGFNLGGGYSYDFRNDMFINAELKYIFSDLDSFVFALGCGFKF